MKEPQARRRRQRRRRRGLSYPLKLATAAGVIAVFVWGLGVVVAKAAHPYWLGHDVGGKVEDARARLAAQRRTNAALRARVARLRSDEGVETLARRQGWRRPGETVFLLPRDDGKKGR